MRLRDVGIGAVLLAMAVALSVTIPMMTCLPVLFAVATRPRVAGWVGLGLVVWMFMLMGLKEGLDALPVFLLGSTGAAGRLLRSGERQVLASIAYIFGHGLVASLWVMSGVSASLIVPGTLAFAVVSVGAAAVIVQLLRRRCRVLIATVLDRQAMVQVG